MINSTILSRYDSTICFGLSPNLHRFQVIECDVYCVKDVSSILLFRNRRARMRKRLY